MMRTRISILIVSLLMLAVSSEATHAGGLRSFLDRLFQHDRHNCCCRPHVSPRSEQASKGALDLPTLWEKVSEVNRVWLEPKPKHLSYTLITGSPPPENKQSSTNRVWISGNKARWEMDSQIQLRNGNRDFSYTMVFGPDETRYIRAPSESMLSKPAPHRDLRNLRQAISWQTAMHAIYESGLPAESRIVSNNRRHGTQIVVIETDLKDRRSICGLGLYHVFHGSSSMQIGRVRLHIRLPDYVPLREEYLDRDVTIVYDPDYLPVGSFCEPRKIQYVSRLRDATPWTLEAQFQTIDGVWLLKEARNIHGDQIKSQMAVKQVTLGPIDPDKFVLPEFEDE